MALTWRNVEAPDFRASMEGYRTFSNLLGEAFSGAQQGLARYDAELDSQANNRFAIDLLKYQDPAAYKAALTSGAIFAGVDPRRISAGNITAAGSRVNDLLAQASSELGLDRARYTDARTRRLDTARDSAAPLVDDYMAAMLSGKGTDWRKANPGFGAGLTLEDMTGLSRDAISAEQSGVNITSGRQNISQGATRFKWETDDRALGEQADTVMMNIMKNSFDSEGAMANLNSMKGLNSKVYNMIATRIPSMFSASTPAGGMISSAASGGGSAGGTNGDPFNVVLGNGAYGTPSKPITNMSIGEVIDFGRSTLIPNSRAAGVGRDQRGLIGSSAVGAYQITSETLQRYAPSVLGSNWREQGFTPENQDKIARVIYQEAVRNKTPLNKVWASLSPEQGRQLAGRPWEEVRGVIAAGESGADPRALALGNAVVQQGAINSNMSRNANGIIATYAKSAQDMAPVADVAARLAKDPALGGMSLGVLNGKLNSIISEAKGQGKNITASVAADILKGSLENNSWAWSAGGWVPDFMANKDSMAVNSKRVSELIKDYSSGAVDDAVAANAYQQIELGGLAQIQAQYQTANARLQNAIAAQRRGVNVNIGPLRAEVNRLSNMLQAGQRGVSSDRAVTSFNGPSRLSLPQSRPVVVNGVTTPFGILFNQR